jgi:hypothetical protein
MHSHLAEGCIKPVVLHHLSHTLPGSRPEGPEGPTCPLTVLLLAGTSFSVRETQHLLACCANNTARQKHDVKPELQDVAPWRIVQNAGSINFQEQRAAGAGMMLRHMLHMQLAQQPKSPTDLERANQHTPLARQANARMTDTCQVTSCHWCTLQPDYKRRLPTKSPRTGTLLAAVNEIDFQTAVWQILPTTIQA